MINIFKKMKHLEEWFGISGLCYLIVLGIISYFFVRSLVGMSIAILNTQKDISPLPPLFETQEARSILGIDQNTVLIQKESISDVVTSTSVTRYVKIIKTPTGFLNVRETPAKSGTIVDKVATGEQYLYLEENNGWYRISVRNKNGWVLSGYTEFVQ